MQATTSFEAFLEANTPQDVFERQDLGNVLRGSEGQFYKRIATDQGLFIIEGPHDPNVRLLITTQRALDYFLSIIDKSNPHKDFDLDQAVEWQLTLDKLNRRE